jgi:GNAT superfamily N-acetyltransferase
VTGEPLRPAAEKVQAVKGVSFRRIDPRRLREEIKLVNGLFNDAWSSNWGFVPMTEEELEFMADELKPVFDPRLSFVAEVGGEPIAFAVALPNVNPVLKKLNGRLFPFGWWHFLTGRKSIDSFRVCLLGVRKDHQRSGIGILSCLRMVKAGLEAGARAAEMSWILETNRAMLAPLDRMGAKPYKRYRIFEKSLTP